MVYLDIPIIKQTKDFPCGPTSLLIISKFLGLSISKEEILSTLKMDSLGRAIMPDIGISAIKIGLKPHIVIANYALFPYEFNELSKDELLAKIKEKIKNEKEPHFKKYCQSILEYLYLGGTLEFRLFLPKDIELSLKKGVPCISFVNTPSFFRKAKDPSRHHFMVIYGMNNKTMVFSDINENSKNKEIKMNITDAMFGMHRAWTPALMLFK